MGVTRVKDGVLFTKIAPGGFRILAAIDKVASSLPFDLTITSACDGMHSGPADPHHTGNAYDVRCHDIVDKQSVLAAILAELPADRFYGFIEDAGGANEHIHAQVKKGTVYP